MGTSDMLVFNLKKWEILYKKKQCYNTFMLIDSLIFKLQT